MATAKELQELEEASNASAEIASAALDTDLRVLMIHVARINELKPKTADEETYRKLVALVQESTRRNESIATLRANVQKLGSGAVALLNEMAKMVDKVV